ncbi:MAG TPA: glycosyltransferase [Stellaceae bacterium]|nr:glycosyltransferase [Stellaceae bacterium]
MTRIVHLITADRIAGGMESFLARLAPALARAGLEQLAITREGPELAEHLRRAGISVAQHALQKRDLRSWWGVRQTFRRFRPQVVLSWLPRAAQRVPRGPWVHAAQVGWYRGLDCYERAERMIVPAPDMARHFKALGFRGEIAVLPHFAPSERLPATARAAFETPPEAPVVLGLGRFDRIKGFDLAVQAIAAVPDAYLWLAGEGEETAELRRLATALGVAERVRFLGWRKDASALLGRAAALVVPSRQEALGLAVLEAWSAGVPVVASDTPGPHYLMAESGSGLLVPIDDAAALAGALRRVLSDRALAARLVAKGEERLAGGFTEAAAVAAYLDYFARVAREAGLAERG